MNYSSLINEFINNSDYFFKEDYSSLDEKHKAILTESNKKLLENRFYFLSLLRDWEKQDDGPVPFQLNKFYIKNNSLFKIILDGMSYVKWKLKGFNILNTFLDDIEVIKKIKGFDLLEKFPVHKTYGVKKVFFINEFLSCNYRWLRYIYLAAQIRNFKILNESSTWLDIGSFYGGIQSIVSGINKNLVSVMLDFNHQLLRSYLFLKTAYPDANHVFPNSAKNALKNISHIKKQSFIYIPVDNIEILKDVNFDLVTSFFSLGELPRKNFNNYIINFIKKKAANFYTVNRFVSSPFFEKTYGNNNDINIFDYILDGYKKEYFDIFPIHHYIIPSRELYGRIGPRPLSSSHFELFQKKIS